MPTLALAKRDEPVPSINRADELAIELSSAADQLLRDGNLQGMSDAALRQAFASLVRLFAAKAEAADFSDAYVPYDAAAVNATETVVTACSMIRAADLNMFDVAMWFARRAATRD